jgi:hypothetical protein
MLVMPALEGVDRLSGLLGPANTSCGAEMRAWVANLLRPLVGAWAVRGWELSPWLCSLHMWSAE